jgi:hypothetical protein
MELANLRWPLLAAALIGAGRCAFFEATPRRLEVTAACGLGWFLLSRRKVHSLDRENRGAPPRR